MLTEKPILQAVSASLVVLLSLAAQPLRAQSDAERLQNLEQAVSQLQKRNAELEKEVSALKKRTSWEPVVGAQGKTKTEVTSDGKTYVEKLVPDLHGGEKWKLFPAITELELFGDLRLRYEYRGGRLPSNDQDHPNDWQERERERYRLRLGFAEHFSMTGSLAFDWRRVPARVHRTLRLVPTHRPAHSAAVDRSQRGTTGSSLARRTEATKAFLALRLPAGVCRTRSSGR